MQACEDVQHALKVKLKMSSAVMKTGRFSPAGDSVTGKPVKGVWHFGGAIDRVSHSQQQHQWCCMLSPPSGLQLDTLGVAKPEK